MARFRFRLETIERLRHAEREERRRALAEAHQAEDELNRLVEDVHSQIEQTRQRRQASALPGPTSVDRLLDAHRYALGLQAQAQGLLEKQELLAAEVARRREALVEADRQVRVMERLREIHRTRRLREERKQENKRLDEVAAQTTREAL
jgi:flagellar export protein FliJ